MFITKKLQCLANECLAWALKEDDPARKQFLKTAARSWATTADSIDRPEAEGRGKSIEKRLN
jgi:hypothetical protein